MDKLATMFGNYTAQLIEAGCDLRSRLRVADFFIKRRAARNIGVNNGNGDVELMVLH